MRFLVKFISRWIDDARGLARVGYFHMLGGMVCMAAVGFSMTLVLAHMLSSREIGQLTVVRQFLLYALIPALVGMDIVVCRYTARESNNPSEQTRIWRFSFRTILIASCVIAGGCYLMLDRGHLILDAGARSMARRLVLILPAIALFDGALGYLQGLKQIRLYALTRALRQIALFVLVVSGVYFWDIRGWVVARGATELLATFFVLGIIFGRGIGLKDPPAEEKKKNLPAEQNQYEMLGFGLYSMLASAFMSITFVAHYFCLDRYVGDYARIGTFAIACFLIDGLLLIPVAMAKTMFPYSAEAAHDPKQLWRHFLSLGKRMGLVITIFTVAALLLAGFIPFLFGSEYADTVLYFRILLIGFVAQSFAMIHRLTGLAAGLASRTCGLAMILGTSNIILNVLFIKFLGMEIMGAVWATVLTHIMEALLSLGLLIWYYRREVRMKDQ